MLARLVQAGADTELKDRRGSTALFWAAKFRKDKAVAKLVEAGANVGAVLAVEPLSSFSAAVQAAVRVGVLAAPAADIDDDRERLLDGAPLACARCCAGGSGFG